MDPFQPVVVTLFRYLHVLSGVLWIGLLYFFNLVNLPLLKIDLKKPFTVNMADKASAHITAKTLFWFRWGAASTLVWGLLLIEAQRRQYGTMRAYMLDNGPPGTFILLAVALAIVMFVNVWFVIWPNQKVILANNMKIAAAGTSDEEKKRLQDENAPRVKMAVMASRTNTWLSVPMLFGMVFGAHGGGDATWTSYQMPLAFLAALLLVMVVYSRPKKV